MSIDRPDGTHMGAPVAETIIQPGEVLIIASRPRAMPRVRPR
jgi:hypothetical protein